MITLHKYIEAIYLKLASNSAFSILILLNWLSFVLLEIFSEHECPPVQIRSSLSQSHLNLLHSSWGIHTNHWIFEVSLIMDVVNSNQSGFIIDSSFRSENESDSIGFLLPSSEEIDWALSGFRAFQLDTRRSPYFPPSSLMSYHWIWALLIYLSSQVLQNPTKYLSPWVIQDNSGLILLNEWWISALFRALET